MEIIFESTVTIAYPKGKTLIRTIRMSATIAYQVESVEQPAKVPFCYFFQRKTRITISSKSERPIRSKEEYDSIKAPWDKKSVHVNYPKVDAARVTYS